MSHKVVVMLLDGMRPDGIEQCQHPFLRELRKESLWSFDAQTVVPSITMPCHISLFNGISPSVHGNLNNSFIPLPADARSLVGECRRGGRRTAMVYSWNELRDIVRPGEVDYSFYERMDNMGRDQQEMIAFERRFVDRALDVIGTGEYDFIFYYYEMADIVGHHQGWMSP